MTADTPPPSTTPAATVRLSGLRVGQIVTLTGTVRTVTQLVPDDHRRVTLDSLATALADLDRAERRLAAVEALVGSDALLETVIRGAFLAKGDS